VGSERWSLVGPFSLLSPRAVISAGLDAVTHCPVEQGKKGSWRDGEWGHEDIKTYVAERWN
jgi:hypothetical protein